MIGIIEKRKSLHRSLHERVKQNRALRQQLQQMQPLADMGSIIAIIAHELNNMLTPLGSYAELAQRHMDDKVLVEKALQKSVINCRRAQAVMQSMLKMAKGEKQDPQIGALKPLVEDVFTCLARDFSKDNITVVVDIAENLQIRVVSVQFQQVLMNLILNAREAMLIQGGGILRIKGYQKRHETVIEVTDTGPGIDQEDLERIFDRFFTTKKEGVLDKSQESGGTGLGLAFCKAIVDAHQGAITVDSKKGQGTTFRIALPRTEA